MSTGRRVPFDSPKSWEIGSESTLHGQVLPDPIVGGAPAMVRITHANGYGPVDDVVFFVRLGDLEVPTRFEDLYSATDWVRMDLVEEVVWVDGEERPRVDVADRLDPREATVWAATFEAEIVLPSGKQRIEIKVLSSGAHQSGVISDWRVKVR